MNKRNLVLQAAVAGALISVFGAAQASTIGRSAATTAIGTYTGDYTIAAESTAQNYTVNLDSAVATVNEGALNDRTISGTIRWIPTFGLNTGDICTFTLTNARYMSADAKLMGEELSGAQPNISTGLTAALCNAGADAGLDINGNGVCEVVEVASNFGALDATNGVTSIQVRINNGLVLPTGINLVLAKSTGATVADSGVLSNETMNPVIRIPAGTPAGAAVNIASSCTTSGGVAIGAATANNNIIDLENQFAFSVTGGTSTIDATTTTPAARTQFVEEGAAGDIITSANDTDLTASAGSFTFNNDSDSTVEDFITLVDADILTMTLTSSTNLDAVASGYFEASPNSTGAADNTDHAFTLASPNMTATALGATDLPARGASITDDIVINVDGNVIEDRTFTAGAGLNFNSAQYADRTWSPATSHTWTTNGTVLQSPWFSTASGYISRFVLTNTSSSPAPYSTVVRTETGNTATLGSAATGTVPANGTLVITATDLVTFSGNTRGTAIFTIAGAKSNIHGVYNIVNATTGSISATNMVTNNGTNADH